MKTSNFMLLAAVVLAAVGAAPPSDAAVSLIDFGTAPLGASPTYAPGGDVANATSINLGGGIDQVNAVFAGNTLGPAIGDHVTITQLWNLAGGVGSDPGVTKTFTTAAGTFTEILNDITSIGRLNPLSLSITMTGTLSGPGITGTSPVLLSFSATQTPAQQAQGTFNWSLTDESFAAGVPGPAPGVGLLASAVLLGFFLTAKAHASRS